MRCAIIIENTGGSSSAWVPDLPGCIATGESRAATEQAIREGIEFRLAASSSLHRNIYTSPKGRYRVTRDRLY